MTEETIKPALTEQEWRAGHAYRDRDGDEALKIGRGFAAEVVFDGDAEMHCGDVSIGPAARHALAAFLLHGQPYGFTWEDVDALRTKNYRPATYAERIHDPRALAAIADRIAALLPPRQTEAG